MQFISQLGKYIIANHKKGGKSPKQISKKNPKKYRQNMKKGKKEKKRETVPRNGPQ